MIMGHIVCKARLSKLELFCHKKLKQGGDLISVFSYLTVESKENTTFGRIHRNRTRGRRQKLQRKFQVEILNIFVVMKMVKCWEKVSGEAVDGYPSLSLEMLRR